MPVTCQRCGAAVPSFSPMRKWCVECRRLVGLEQARERKVNGHQQIRIQKPMQPLLKLKI